MRTLSSADLVDVWDRGSSLHPLDRSLILLHTALPETYRRLADWPLGRRNQALAELREACFGPRLEAWTACPRCAEKLEFQMDTRSLVGPLAPIPDAIEIRGESFRPPNSRDLAIAAQETNPRTAAIRLMEACRTEACEPRAWSEQDIDEAGEQMARADPMAEIRLTLDCPACGNRWDETLDIGEFFWTEVASRARLVLRDVHILASAYGWTEREILNLTEARRAIYLEMLQV
jgi:hypothetical protein